MRGNGNGSRRNRPAGEAPGGIRLFDNGENMKRWVVVVLLGMVLGGCASRVAAPSRDAYPYHAMNNDCSCEHYVVSDARLPIQYEFSAVYSVEEGITTRIVIVIKNNAPDTLDTSLGLVRVASRNVPYQYNNKFVPLTIPSVPPHDEGTITLVGSSTGVSSRDPWLHVAGEEMVVTLKGLRVGRRQVSTQTVRFVPYNPKLAG
jgi:hypothetical protein